MSKTNLELVQEIVEAKLNNLDNKIDANNKNLTDKIDSNNKYSLELLTVIKEQTFKTNGKVVSLDRELRDLTTTYHKHLLSSATSDDVSKLNRKIDVLGEENFIIKVWNKYPKAFATIIIVSILISMATIGYTMISVRHTINEINNIEKVVK